VLRTTFAAIALVFTTAAITACGSAAPTAPTVVTETVTVPIAAPPAASAGTAVSPSFTPATASWTMPNLVGTGLQEAQDAVQQLTSYGIPITTSHDATGAARMQLSDRNWKVCTQNVLAGAAITPNTRIDFGAVKLEEDC
jgi:hypothetical protein